MGPVQSLLRRVIERTLKRYDALIIGGGPAGSTAAHLLARDGWSVAIFEKAVFPRRKVCGEFISAGSIMMLRKLGLADDFLTQAGPQVRQIGLFSGQRRVCATMPSPRVGPDLFGHALDRARLDTMMLQAAVTAGAELWQPWTLRSLGKTADGHSATALSDDRSQSRTFEARIVIAAHGSWEQGLLPTQVAHFGRSGADLFAFKAHFRGCQLPAEMMSLLAFPGGYGGMVHSDRGRVSLSCCIRRDWLARCRRNWPQRSAAEAVLAHIRSSSHAGDAALHEAILDSAWNAAGPIRPGIRTFRRDGVFCVGNAAGEAHPIVAEGISMAIEGSWHLCQRLLSHKAELSSTSGVARLAAGYEADWRRACVPRIQAAAAVAGLATRPAAARVSVALLAHAPQLLTLGAAWSGKARRPKSWRYPNTAV